MNAVMTVSAAGLLGLSSRLLHIQFVVTALAAAYGLTVGALFLFGASRLLPAIG